MSRNSATETELPERAGGNRPVQVIRYGSIRAAIWKNVVDNGNTPREVYNVTFSRGYHDGNQWRDSSSFGVDDLLLLAKAANDAHTWIYRQRSSSVQSDVAGAGIRSAL